MANIPMQHRGKRPRFFAAEGMDEMMSMVLELTAEVWVLKKRMYLLEKVAEDSGVSLTPGIENYDLSDEEVRELDGLRRSMIASVLRSTESDFSPTQRFRKSATAANPHVEAA